MILPSHFLQLYNFIIMVPSYCQNQSTYIFTLTSHIFYYSAYVLAFFLSHMMLWKLWMLCGIKWEMME